MTRRASPKVIKLILSIVRELGSDGHLVYEEVLTSLGSQPLRSCIKGWAQGQLGIIGPSVEVLVRATLVGLVGYKPPKTSRIEGIEDPDVADAWWDQLHPKNIKRGRSDPGPQNKRRWKQDPDTPIKYDRELR